MNILSKTAETVAFDGAAHEASAIALGNSLGHALDNDLATISKAKADYEGGCFVVLFNLFNHLTAEQVAALPDHEAETGNNPRFYKTRKMKSDGKEKVTDRDYYKVIAESLPDVQAKQARIEMIGRSMKDPTKFNLSDIPKDISDMLHHRRHAEIKKLQRDIATAMKNVPDALELYSQMQRFQTLQGVTMELLFALNDKGEEMDGEGGRDRKIDDTSAPIIITTKLEKRKGLDTARVSKSGFMKFDVPKAREQGGTWEALMATVKKGTKEKDEDGKANAVNIETVDTAERVFNDLAEYIARIQDQPTKADWQALEKALKGAGSDDAFYNARVIFEGLRMLVGDPKSDVRWQKLFQERDQAAA